MKRIRRGDEDRLDFSVLQELFQGIVSHKKSVLLSKGFGASLIAAVDTYCPISLRQFHGRHDLLIRMPPGANNAPSQAHGENLLWRLKISLHFFRENPKPALMFQVFLLGKSPIASQASITSLYPAGDIPLKY
jgi:hypothetical protein